MASTRVSWADEVDDDMTLSEARLLLHNLQNEEREATMVHAADTIKRHWKLFNTELKWHAPKKPVQGRSRPANDTSMVSFNNRFASLTV